MFSESLSTNYQYIAVFTTKELVVARKTRVSSIRKNNYESAYFFVFILSYMQILAYFVELFPNIRKINSLASARLSNLAVIGQSKISSLHDDPLKQAAGFLTSSQCPNFLHLQSHHNGGN